MRPPRAPVWMWLLMALLAAAAVALNWMPKEEVLDKEPEVWVG